MAETAATEETATETGTAGSVPEETFSEAFIRGVKGALPMQVGFIPLSFILGTQGGQHGLSALGMALMVSFNFAGGSEFAAVALWSATPSFLVIFVTTWLINCRHIVLGAALTPWMERARTPVWASMLSFFVMCDEVWALSMQEIERKRKRGIPAEKLFSFPYHLGVGISLWTLWWISAGTGAAVGTALGDLTRWGFLMAFPATFIGLVVAMRPALGKSLPMVVSGVAAALASLWLPLHWSILIATVLGLATAAFVPDLPVGRKTE